MKKGKKCICKKCAEREEEELEFQNKMAASFDDFEKNLDSKMREADKILANIPILFSRNPELVCNIVRDIVIMYAEEEALGNSDPSDLLALIAAIICYMKQIYRIDVEESFANLLAAVSKIPKEFRDSGDDNSDESDEVISAKKSLYNIFEEVASGTGTKDVGVGDIYNAGKKVVQARMKARASTVNPPNSVLPVFWGREVKVNSEGGNDG